MSGHQQRPPYGALYSSSLPVNPSSAVSYGMQQYRNQPQEYNSNWQSQSSSNGMSFPQNANGYVHANPQVGNPPAVSAGAALTPYGGYANAAQYRPAPTLFYSAVPNATFAATPLVHQPLVSSNNTSSHETNAKDLSAYQPIPTMPPMDTEDPEAAKEPSAELEDGELSGGESGKASGDLHEKTAVVHEPSSAESLHPHVSELDNVIDQETSDSFGSVNQVSRRQPVATKVSIIPRVSPKPTPSAREQAQAILRELHLYNIGFREVAKEGFEMDLLRDLFVEMGLPAPALEQDKPQQKDEEASKQTVSTISKQMSNLGKSQENSSNILSDPKVGTKTPDAKDSTGTSAISNLVDDAGMASLKNQTPIKSTRLTSTGKSAVKVPATKPLDRKEYIARLLAAKTGKPLQGVDAALETSQAPSDAEESAPSTEGSAFIGAQDISTTNNVADPARPLIASNHVSKGISDLEAKRKAQTELARQKMEALRAQKKGQQQQAQPASFEGPDPHSGSLTVETVDSTPSQTHAQVPTSAESRQASYFSPVSLKPAFSIPGLFTMAQETSPDSQAGPSNPATVPTSLESGKDTDATDTGIGPRKRHKAADFMGPTSNTLHKSLSRAEDISVVIDISDDEIENPEDEVGPRSPSRLPPPSDLAAAGKEAQDIVNGSPRVSNTPGKAQEPEELRIKENAIETMNRKILELEQRIKAKQAASRAQSPRVPANTLSNKGMAAQGPPIPVSQYVETATEEQLLNEKEKQQDKLASAEAEQCRIASVEQQSNVENQSQAREPAGRIEFEHSHQDSNIQKSVRQAELQGENSDYASNQRKIKLESELSALDADIAGSKEKLQFAQLDVGHLEKQLHSAKLDVEHYQYDLQTKADRRRLLHGQFIDLSNPMSISQESEQQSDRRIDADKEKEQSDQQDIDGHADPSNGTQPQMGSTEQDGLSPRELATLGHGDHSKDQVRRDITKLVEESGPASTTPPKLAEPNEVLGDVDPLSTGELEEDNMDISGSDVEEGQVLNAREERASQREDPMDTSDDEDFYEPPSHIGSTQQSASNLAETQTQIVHSEPEAPSLHAPASLAADQVDKVMTDARDNAPVQPYDGEERTLDCGFAQSVAKEDDDYEPPEPESFATVDTVPFIHPNPTNDPTDSQPPEMSAKDGQLIAKTKSENGHFIPYESPLKQFASYRFHPDFRSEVSGGYRSLTYSHNIRPEIPLCQYELGGGVCNDKSCMSQHFQKMVLPDHIILGAMGKGEGATPEEKDEYIKGLKTLIVDLRERRIKDLDAIAEAIAQYRIQFLDDPSRVLPL